jgi:hypothetical protein
MFFEIDPVIALMSAAVLATYGTFIGACLYFAAKAQQ